MKGRSLPHAAEGNRVASGPSNAEHGFLRGSLQSGGAPGIHHALRGQQNKAVEGSHRILLQKQDPHLCLSPPSLLTFTAREPAPWPLREQRPSEHVGPQQPPFFLEGLS